MTEPVAALHRLRQQIIGALCVACLLSAVVGVCLLAIGHVMPGLWRRTGEHAKAWGEAELRNRVLVCEALGVDEEACRRKVVARCIGRVGEAEDMVLACYQLGGIEAPARLRVPQPDRLQ